MDLQIPEKEDKKSKARVKVAIRIRPLIAKQQIDNQSFCIDAKSTKQVVIGGDRPYKFDRIFGNDSHQGEIYQQCVRDLVLGCFEGYNAAVLAYGQTGSGKTFTMGTSAATLGSSQSIGIIPRVIEQIFTQVKNKKDQAEFIVRVSFLEIYNEQIIDLLGDRHQRAKDNNIVIRQEKGTGTVSIIGVAEETVKQSSQLIHLLQKGGYNRTTASTLMNDASSRSHAIFTITIETHAIADLYKTQNKATDQEGFTTAKFFFVDLAGSERAKKTGATGSTFKQGVNINLGLLELGNVISALSTIEKKQDQFITYRNSKLTRILQDCLGGNSNTYMIACVSPAESNFQQSLNTLKYASKAMNIKNKPVVNRDPKSAELNQLRQRIYELQSQNRKLKQMLNQKGVNMEQFDTNRGQLDFEVNKLNSQNRTLIKKIQTLTQDFKSTKHRLNELEISNYQLKSQKTLMQFNLEQLIKQNPHFIKKIEKIKEQTENQGKNNSILEKYQNQIEQLQNQVEDKNKIIKQIEEQYEKTIQNYKKDEKILIKKNNMLYALGKENLKLKEQLSQKNNLTRTIDNNDIGLNTSNTTTKPSTSLNEQYAQLEQLMFESQQVVEKDEQIVRVSEDYEKNQERTKGEMELMDQYIKERQQFLQKISLQQISLENQLICQMKNEYHQKIVLLQKQKKNLIKKKDEPGNVDKNKFIHKIQNLEGELKDFRKKAKQQKNIERLLDNQNGKIKDLSSEIKKFKTQKIDLFKKLKQDKDSFNKLKTKRVKELMAAKKQSFKKQSQIKKLTSQNIKSKLVSRKKQQQIRKVKRVNETLKTLIKNNTSSARNSKRQNIRQSFRQSGKVESSQQRHYSSRQQLRKLQKQNQQFVLKIVKHILEQIDREHQLSKYNTKIQQSQNQLTQLLHQDSAIKLKLQRLKLKDEEEITEEQKINVEELEVNIADLRQRIIICEDNINFCRSKQNEVIQHPQQFFDLEISVIYHKNYEHMDNLRAFIRSFFALFKNLLYENYQMVNQRQHKQNTISTLNQNIHNLRQQLLKNRNQYQDSLSQLRQQMTVMSYDRQYKEQQQVPDVNSFKKYEERDRKDLQRKVVDLSKTNRHLAQQLEKTRRKCIVVQEKYQNIKNLVSKDKNIGRQDSKNLEELHLKPEKKLTLQKQVSKKQTIEELNDMMDNIDRLKKVKSMSTFEDSGMDKQKDQPFQRHSGQYYQYSIGNKWQCTAKIDAHNSSVLSMAIYEQYIISTATKSLKIWDLQTRKMICELSSPHLNATVRYVMVDPERRLLFAACDKQIPFWDLTSMESQGILKSHVGEVRTMHSSGDYLFTGGKGGNHNGSLLIWDLRKLDPTKPFEQKQKSQDIFSFSSNEDTLYYGTRNHSVRRMNISSLDIQSPFEPPHMDTVTGLTVTRNNYLVSGSKDKYLRLWSLDHAINNSKYTLHAFNDHVTSVHGNSNQSLFYCGSKDGQVKACIARNDKIETVGTILGHTQAVNAISSFEDYQGLIATASQDKTIKIWQATKETTENIYKEDNI